MVSDSSVSKDTTRLWKHYYQAGVPEYWIVDARRGRLHFEIWRAESAEYTATEVDADGFQYSQAMQASYRMEMRRRSGGRIQYDLHERCHDDR